MDASAKFQIGVVIIALAATFWVFVEREVKRRAERKKITDPKSRRWYPLMQQIRVSSEYKHGNIHVGAAAPNSRESPRLLRSRLRSSPAGLRRRP